jgi:hypothetical protein
MRLAVSVVLLLSLCPMRAGLGRELGGLKISGHEGEPMQEAQGSTDQPSQVQKGEKKPLTNADVVSMVRAGLAQSTIVLAIQHNPTVFDISPQALISLHRLGVPPIVLDAMLTVGSEKPTPPAGPPERTPTNPASLGPLQNGSSEGIKIKGSAPDLHTIRKVLLETDWADDENVVAQKIKAVEKHTCLQVVQTSGAEDAILKWSIEGFDGAALELRSDDGQVLWSKVGGFTKPLGALKRAVGCPK